MLSRKRRNLKHKKQAKIKIEQEADSLEELLVNWLNELLSLSATKELIFSDFQIIRIDNNTLKALVTGEDISSYRVNSEIKAATYYDLKVEETDSGWQAQLIFDV
ncbi:MAG: archease [Candidatus Omnitrophota bacterium]